MGRCFNSCLSEEQTLVLVSPGSLAWEVCGRFSFEISGSPAQPASLTDARAAHGWHKVDYFSPSIT